MFEYFDLAQSTHAMLVPAPEPDIIPAALFHMNAGMRGEDLSLAYKHSELSQWLGGYASEITYDVHVETGADMLQFLITPGESILVSWDVQFTLSGPDGEVFTRQSTEVLQEGDDHSYLLVQVPTPSTGSWTMRLAAPATQEPILYPEVQNVMAHVSHDGFEDPRCRVATRDMVLHADGDSQLITVEADWLGPVGEGAQFTGYVEDPSGAAMPLAFDVSSSGLARATVENFQFDGIYRVFVTCDVDESALYVPQGADDNPSSGNVVVGAFVRTGFASFGVDAGLPVTRKGQVCARSEADFDYDGIPDRCDDDIDGDGLSNNMEAAFDTDGDGVFDQKDRDSDDDGEPDGLDQTPRDPYGYRRYASGDFNGDGLPDSAVGDPLANSGRGNVAVRTSNSSGVAELWSQNHAGVLEFSEVDDAFGTAVAAGDFNDDGFDDLAVGVPGEDYGILDEAGVVHVIYGSSLGLTGAGDQLWKEGLSGVKGTAEDGDGFGSRLTVGDFNCDGYSDLVIGSPDEAIGSKHEAGAVHVIYGSAGGLTSVADVWYQGNSGVNGSSEVGDRFGDTLVTADFDADGCQDLVIGAPTEDLGAALDAGNAYAIYGSIAGLSTSGDWTIVQGSLQQVPEYGDLFATRLWTKDFNRDGYDDLAVMTPGDSYCGPGFKGFNFVFGGASGLTLANNVWFCREYY